MTICYIRGTLHKNYHVMLFKLRQENKNCCGWHQYSLWRQGGTRRYAAIIVVIVISHNNNTFWNLLQRYTSSQEQAIENTKNEDCCILLLCKILYIFITPQFLVLQRCTSVKYIHFSNNYYILPWCQAPTIKEIILNQIPYLTEVIIYLYKKLFTFKLMLIDYRWPQVFY